MICRVDFHESRGSAEFGWRYHAARSNLWWAAVDSNYLPPRCFQFGEAERNSFPITLRFDVAWIVVGLSDRGSS